MTKLSKAQVAILRRMGEGETLVQFYDGGLFCWAAKPTTGPPKASVKPLIDGAFISYPTNDKWFRYYWRITPAGRAYLEEHDHDKPILA